VRRSKSSDQTGIRHVGHSADYTVDAQKRLVVVKFGKKVTVQDIERYSHLLRANPAFHPAFSEITDLTEVEDLNLQADEFLRLADEIDPFSVDARRAFVVRTPVQNHAARMHKILRLQRNFEIFETMEEAESWVLGNFTPTRA
jgi:hypothetical protein